jgi:hypothetical protein
VARAIVRVRTALLHIAENNVLDFLRIDAGTLDCFLRCDGAKINRRNSGKFAVVTRHWRARSGQNYNISGKHHSSLLEL